MQKNSLSEAVEGIVSFDFQSGIYGVEPLPLPLNNDVPSYSSTLAVTGRRMRNQNGAVNRKILEGI